MDLDERPLRCPGCDFLCRRVFSSSVPRRPAVLACGHCQAGQGLRPWARDSAGAAWPHGGAGPRVRMQATVLPHPVSLGPVKVSPLGAGCQGPSGTVAWADAARRPRGSAAGRERRPLGCLVSLSLTPQLRDGMVTTVPRGLSLRFGSCNPAAPGTRSAPCSWALQLGAGVYPPGSRGCGLGRAAAREGSVAACCARVPGLPCAGGPFHRAAAADRAQPAPRRPSPWAEGVRTPVKVGTPASWLCALLQSPSPV